MPEPEVNGITRPERRTRQTPAQESGGLVRRLLRLPLFYKLIVANGAITLLAVVVSAGFIAMAVRENPAVSTTRIILPVALAAIALSVLVNAVVVHLALRPLRALEKTAAQVRAGDLTVRPPESAISDASIESLVGTFTGMLESLTSYREQLREIAIRALDAAENERLRLSRELHDSLAQSLTALLLQLKVARGASGTAQAEHLTQVAEQLAGIIEEVRLLANQLMPPALEMLGLEAALSGHVRAVGEASGVNVSSDIGPINGTLSPESELALYRLVQEALLNVVRHSETEDARLEVRRRNGQVEATVTDRGRGFDVEPTMAGWALGLIGMVERAAYVGGKVEVDSAPGQGTTVRIVIPAKGNDV